MNDKERLLRGIVDIGVSCCATQIDEHGTMTITLDDVLGKNKCENLLMARSLIVAEIRRLGYSVETIARIFKRTAPAIRNLVATAKQYHSLSYAFRLAEREMKERLKERFGIWNSDSQ